MTNIDDVIVQLKSYDGEKTQQIASMEILLGDATNKNQTLVTQNSELSQENEALTDQVTQLQAELDALKPPPQPTSTVLIGVSTSDEDHGYYPWGAAHCYNKGDVDDSQLTQTQAAAKTPKVSPVGAKSVCFTDSARWTTAALSSSAVEAIRQDLLTLRSKYPNLIIRYGWGNEIDRKISNDAGIAVYVSNVKALRQMINGLNDPKITLWSSFTKGVFDPKAGWIPTKAPQWSEIKQWVHGIAANLYPPSRDDAPLTADKVSKFPDFCDLAIKQAADWGVLFGVWETGHPVFNFPNNAAPYRNRPEYMKALRDYVKSKCASLNVTVTEICYWDQQLAGSGAPDNRLFNDAPKTAQAFNSV